MTKIGERYTKQRKIIFDALAHFSPPVTVKELKNYFQLKKMKIDMVSIYRTLSLLKKNNLINIVLYGDGKKRYELKMGKKHHHHLICENCGSIEDVEVKENVLLATIKNRSKFLIKNHDLEFFGLCHNCQ